MGTRYDQLQDQHIGFVRRQPIFFVATAAPESRINLSPKGMDSLRILSPTRILWRNMTGSGNETAPHLARDPRMTLMWCSFDRTPLILRAYGRAEAIHRSDPRWDALDAAFEPDSAARQLIDMRVELVQQSCGHAVPLMSLEAERPVLRDWAARKGAEGIASYWRERNAETIDGLPTGIADLNADTPPRA